MKHKKGNMKEEAVVKKERQAEIKDQQSTCDRKTKGVTQQEEEKQSETQKEERVLWMRDEWGKL